MEGLTLSSGLAGLAVVAGLFLMIASLRTGSSSPNHPAGRSNTPAEATPEPASTKAVADSLHESWSLSEPGSAKADPTKQAVIQRRAEVLTGLQLVVLAVVLLIGGLVFTRVILADQLPLLLGR